MPKSGVIGGFALLSMLLISGCGFTPIYATPEGEAASLNQLVAVRSVAASDTVLPLVTSALENRIKLKEGEEPKYDLYVQATERAERLAVQIDATVTRYNYRLIGRYSLVDLETGKRIRGRAQAVTSYNIVSSQYSTLFAERAAQEKAAQLLAEEIERDLLTRFADKAFENTADDVEPDLIFDERDLIGERKREGAVPDPFTEQQ